MFSRKLSVLKRDPGIDLLTRAIAKAFALQGGKLFCLLLACAVHAESENHLATANDVQSITVASAANFTPTLRELVALYEDDPNNLVKITVVSGSSGKLSAQILQGAPFDIFFSADSVGPRKLVAAGKAVESSQFTYAIGRLALVTRHPAIGKPLIELLSGRFNRLAIANPELAPYGSAAIETLEALGILRKTRSRLVNGENIAQTFQFVASGNAELGMVAWSQIQSANQRDKTKDRKYSYWLVPDDLHNTIRQDAVLIDSANADIARRFLEFVRSQTAERIIVAAGYGVESKSEGERPLAINSPPLVIRTSTNEQQVNSWNR